MNLKHLHGASAKIIANTSNHYFAIGAIVELLHDECCDYSDIKALSGGNFWFVGADDIEVLSAPNITYEHVYEQIREIAVEFQAYMKRSITTTNKTMEGSIVTTNKTIDECIFDAWAMSSGAGKPLLSLFPRK